jgi:membrane fusion protein (multidrug efflux system)
MPVTTENDKHKPENEEQEGQQSRQKAPSQAPPDPVKKKRTLLLGGLVLIVLAVAGFLWWSYTNTYESTDDAQVDGHLNPIGSRIAGTVKAVYVEDNQFVKAGQPLVDLDTTDAEITLAQSQAQLDQSIGQLRGEQPNVPITITSNATDTATAESEVANADASLASAQQEYLSDVAQLAQAEANNGKAQSDLQRYRQLIDKHEVAQSDYDQYDATAKAQAATVASQKALVASAEHTIEQRQAQLNEQRAKLQQTITNAPRQLLIKNANIQQRKGSMESSETQVRQDKVNLSYCHIVAPVSGLISQRSAEVGSRISIGQQLMMVIQTDDLWVTANFKETQLRRIKTGQRVSIKVDALDKTLEGYVESLPASTGDRTSALPPENATGNYVKIVQRLPLRIRFKTNQDGFDELRPGMSVEPKIWFK